MLCRRFICNFIHKNFFSTYNKPLFTIQSNFVNKVDDKTEQLFKTQQVPNLYTVKRFKHKKKESTKQTEVFEDEDEEDEDISNLIEPYEKVFSKTVPSVRLDVIIKAGLGMARNKVDVAFYESKIRINRNKVLKKSIEVKVGDEIDIMVGKSPDNPDFIVVHRIRLVSVNPSSTGYKVKLVRDKSLVIEDYKDYHFHSSQ